MQGQLGQLTFGKVFTTNRLLFIFAGQGVSTHGFDNSLEILLVCIEDDEKLDRFPSIVMLLTSVKSALSMSGCNLTRCEEEAATADEEEALVVVSSPYSSSEDSSNRARLLFLGI